MAVAEMMEMEEAEETSRRNQKRKRGGSTSKTERKTSSKKKEKEDVCFICFESFDGGNNLLPCDHRGCTKVYHPACVDRDESIPCKSRWNCAWHNCSNCDKSAHYMCYMCTYSLCKSCSNEADFLCARENKGFCESCMSIVNQIEKNEQGNKEMAQAGFNDKNRWEYLFKDYWVHLKGRLLLNLDILTQVGHPCKESMGMDHKRDSSKEVYDDDQNCKSNSSSGNIKRSNSEIKKARGQLNCFKEEDLASMIKTVSGEGISISNESNDTDWATKELLEFVAHVKNGDLSVLSLSGVQALVLGYIKQNNLRHPRRKNQIVCDSTLCSLFGKAYLKHFEMLSLLKSHLILKSSKEIYDANHSQNANSNNSSGNLELSHSEIRNANGKSNSLMEEDSVTVGSDGFGEAISISNNADWASKELLEIVAYVKNGDLSVMSLFDVQSLLLDYVRLNNLRDPIRKSQISCDSRLRTLFGKQCVMHFEMLRLVESHLLVNKDIQSAEIHGEIVDIEAGKLDADSTVDPQTKMVADKRCKTWKKGVEKGPWAIFFGYAAICVHNLDLIFLKRSLLEDLLEDDGTFEEKVIGSFVRIKLPGFGQRKDLHRLVRVVGAKRVAEPYKVGMRITDVMLEIQNLNERFFLSIDAISDQEFTEDECVNLRQSMKCGFVCPLRVGEIQEKVMALHAVRVNNCLQKEILQLCHLRDRASEKGRRKELRECLKKLQILETPEERSRRLKDISEVHADPKMDPNYVSEADEEPDVKTPGCCKRTRDGGFSMKGRNPSSPEKGSLDSHDAWSGDNINSITDQEASRTVSTKDMLEGDNGADAGESPWNQGLHAQNSRCKQSYNQGPATGSESGASNDQALVTSGSSSVILPETAVASLPAASSLPAPEILSSTISDTKSCHGNEEGRRKHTSRAKYDEELNDKIWHYQDPSGKIQGPYSIVQLRKWCGTGYFPANLRLWRTTENQDQDSILMTDALNGKFLKNSPHNLVNDGVSQALCLQQKIVSEPNESISLVNSFVSGSPTDGDNLTPLSRLVFPVAVKGAGDMLLPGSQDDPSTSLHSSIPEADPGRARDPLSFTDARQSPQSTMIDLHGVSQCDFLDPPNESGLPAYAEVGGDFLPGSKSDPSTSLHSSSPEADRGRANNRLSSIDARQIPQFTMIDDTHRVSQGDVFDRPNELGVQLPTGAEVYGQIGSSEISTKTQTLVPEPLALASSGTLMHTVADPVSGRNSPSNAASMSVLFGALSVGKHEPQDDNHVLQPCSTQKLEIDSRPGIETLGWGSVLSHRLEPSSSPVPLPVSQKPEEPDYGHRDDNGPSSFKMSDGSFGTEDQTGYLPSPRFSVSDSVPPCNWTDAAITESADWSTSSTDPPVIKPSSWSFSIHGNNSTTLSRMAIETNPHMQSSVPSTNLDVRVLVNPNNGWGPTPEDSNTGWVPWGPHQGTTNTKWGVSRQRRGTAPQWYTPSNQGAIPQESDMGYRVAPQINTEPRTMPWGNHIQAAGAVLQGGDNNGWVAASHGNATGCQGTMLRVKNTGWRAPTANIDPRTMPWGNHTPLGAVLQGGDNNDWVAASHGNVTGYQGTMQRVKNTGWRAPTANIDPRTMPWGNHTPRGAVLQGGDNNDWVAASHVNTTGGQGTMLHVNNNGWHAPAVNIGKVSSQGRGNGGRSFGQWGRGSHGGDPGHGGWRASWNRQSRSGGRGRGSCGFSGPFPEGQVCKFYKKGYCKWENECKYLHPS